MSIIDKLAESGANVLSVRDAILWAINRTRPDNGDDANLDREFIAFQLETYFNTSAGTKSAKELQIDFRYFVRAAVELHLEKQEVTPEAIRNRAKDYIEAFWKSFEFLIPVYVKPRKQGPKQQGPAVTITTDVNGVQTVSVDKAAVKRKGGKQEAAMAIYKANPTLTQKELVERFIAELGMTKSGASTYAYNVRKLWNASQEQPPEPVAQ